MRKYEIEAVIADDGRLLLTDLPFRAGEQVDVVVKGRSEETGASESDDPYPLRGLPYRYDDPCSSVAEDDWAALR